MCNCSEPKVVWDPKLMEVDKEYPRVVNGRNYVGVKQSTGEVDIYEVITQQEVLADAKS